MHAHMSRMYVHTFMQENRDENLKTETEYVHTFMHTNRDKKKKKKRREYDDFYLEAVALQQGQPVQRQQLQCLGQDELDGGRLGGTVLAVCVQHRHGGGGDALAAGQQGLARHGRSQAAAHRTDLCKSTHMEWCQGPTCYVADGALS